MYVQNKHTHTHTKASTGFIILKKNACTKNMHSNRNGHHMTTYRFVDIGGRMYTHTCMNTPRSKDDMLTYSLAAHTSIHPYIHTHTYIRTQMHVYSLTEHAHAYSPCNPGDILPVRGTPNSVQWLCPEYSWCYRSSGAVLRYRTSVCIFCVCMYMCRRFCICMCICVCACVCLCMCMWMRMRMRMWTCMCMRMCKCMSMRMRMRMRISMRMLICMYMPYLYLYSECGGARSWVVVLHSSPNVFIILCQCECECECVYLYLYLYLYEYEYWVLLRFNRGASLAHFCVRLEVYVCVCVYMYV
jgi:hypothetical protein